ncbi:hypothetical protein N8697_00715 [bacterium]|nr:hypothetical protein [bacterium]
MRRTPPRLRGSSKEAAHHNAIRDMVRNLRPIRSANMQTRFTTGGVVRAGQAGASASSASAQAVWL